MAEIITDFGEVRLSLKEYNDMRDKIRQLEEDNDALVEERDMICDENKVRVRRQIIKITEPSCDPRALGTKEIIEDRLINMEDITQELDAKIHEIENGWMKRVEELQSNLNSTEKTLEQCHSQYGDTHYVRGDIPRDLYDRMSDEQRRSYPILGNMRPIQPRQQQVTQTVDMNTPDGQQQDDLPF